MRIALIVGLFIWLWVDLKLSEMLMTSNLTPGYWNSLMVEVWITLGGAETHFWPWVLNLARSCGRWIWLSGVESRSCGCWILVLWVLNLGLVGGESRSCGCWISVLWVLNLGLVGVKSRSCGWWISVLWVLNLGLVGVESWSCGC